ncbi:MAG TPA: GTPase [Gammaproteobacteria bacterium]|nr:GTPase [Gammaproteobacteria bacterium]
MNEHQLNSEIQHYSDWRGRLSACIQTMSSFLKDHNITDMRTHHEFSNILGALADDRLSVAFVAEFSRGKTEMINTLFFGNYKKRILPSGVGRTTMCPTEILYDPNLPTSVRLLPIESREDDRPIFELKDESKLWIETQFDADDVDSVVKALQGMTDNKLVSKEYARKLRFDLLDADDSEIGLPINEFDEVEIPKWRHAVINLPHPLLEQGLVVLDTPGLNAIGAEPELTINQLASAHTVVFILSHDTGVTSTDLALWEQHLTGNARNKGRLDDVTTRRRLVALNKIDTLWDGIRTEEEIEAEIKKQVLGTSVTLRLPEENIFPVSAQKALLAKLSGDDDLLERSRMPALETALAEKLIPEKRQIVVDKVKGSINDIVGSADTILSNRLRDAEAHIAELKQLSTKNTDVISHIMVKVQSEKSALENDMKRYQALRAVYSKETTKLARILSAERLEARIAKTKHLMAKSATSVSLQRAVTHYFEQLNSYLDDAIMQSNEIAYLCENITRDFEQDHGIANFSIRRLRLEKYKQEVSRLERKHLKLMDTRSLFFREQMSITNRFYDSVCNASRKIFERASRDATNWNNNLMVPMETYVREHHTQLRRRLESVKRIHKASDTVEARLRELGIMQTELTEQHSNFNAITKEFDALLNEVPQAPMADGDHTAEILYWSHKPSF